jgi:hypothetical protein
MVCVEQRNFSFDVQPSKLAIGSVMIVGLFLLGTTAVDYVRIQRWLYRDMSKSSAAVSESYYRELASWGKGSLLEPQVIRILAAVMPPTRDHLSEKRIVCARALQSQPESPAVFTCALLDSLAGEEALAEQNWRQAVRVFGTQQIFGNQVSDYVQKLEAGQSSVDPDALAFARRMQAVQTH